jgi:hypothetical protein
MDLTRALDERFLWIDRLCIVQNDPDLNGTMSQITKMNKIYAGAWLTIIAAAPEAMYDRSVTTDWPSFNPVVQPFKRLSWMTEPMDVLEIRDAEEMEIMTIMVNRYGVLDQSKWATRGWTYQEQILCKRAVVFVENGLFWHCECCMWDGVDLVPDRNFHRVAVRSQKIEAKWWPNYNLYLDTICAYNGRDFSYPQDALLGVAGIFSAALSSFPGGFISGLPRLFLDHTLLWQPFGITSRRLDRQDSPVPHSSLPSYSWCGWQCFVEPRSLRSGLSYIDEADCQQHAESWRTRHTVDWNICTVDSLLKTIREPQELEMCIDLMDRVDNKLPPGWARGGSERASASASMPSTPGFFHETDKNVFFTHPIPLAKEGTHQNDVTISARLEGSTTTATFSPSTVLLEVDMMQYQQFSASFISVFKSQMFELGPGEGKACPVLVLQTPLGGFAGLLQLMNNDVIEKSVPIELIAISKGSTTGHDMRQSYLWTAFETGRKGYNHRSIFRTFGYEPERLDNHTKASLIVDLDTAFSREAADLNPCRPEIVLTLRTLERRCETWSSSEQGTIFFRPLTESEMSSIKRPERFWQKDYGIRGSWFWHRNRFMRKRIKAHQARYTSFRIRREIKEGYKLHNDPKSQLRWQARARWLTLRDMISDGSLLRQIRGTSPDHPYSKPPELLCEFYNVLWIERKGGISYRRACGWVPKYIWEAHATGPVEVTLG